MSVLDKIAAGTRKRVAARKARLPAEALRERLRNARSPRPFAARFLKEGIRVIAEVKLASPSEGDLAPGLDPVATALDYEAAGAAAVSVLTEPDFFKGDIRFLRAIREKTSLPLLMKDFLIDEYQVLEARDAGADCVLLIAALLGRKRLASMLAAAREAGLDALVEVHDEEELQAALVPGADLIGVNNRDLKTLKVNLDTARRLAGKAAGRALICESGITTRSQMEELASLGYRGFLIGTHLIKSGRPGAALAELLRG